MNEEIRAAVERAVMKMTIPNVRECIVDAVVAMTEARDLLGTQIFRRQVEIETARENGAPTELMREQLAELKMVRSELKRAVLRFGVTT